MTISVFAYEDLLVSKIGPHNITILLLRILYFTLFIATSWMVRLRVGRSGDRIPVGARFSAPVHTCPGTYPACYTTGTGYFLGVKQPERVVDHPPHLAPRIKEEKNYTSTPHLGPRGLFWGDLYLYLSLSKHHHCFLPNPFQFLLR